MLSIRGHFFVLLFKTAEVPLPGGAISFTNYFTEDLQTTLDENEANGVQFFPIKLTDIFRF